MKTDVLMPKNNEEELLKQAELLGFKEIIFLYTEQKTKLKLENNRKVKVFTGFLIKNMSEAQRYSKNHDFIFAPAERPYFENKQIDYLINAEVEDRLDSVHQRRAGLDDVMCKLAFQKGKTIIFNISLLKKPIILGRMKQNAKLCRKHKVKTLVATFASQLLEMRAPKDLDGFANMISTV